MRIVQLMLKKRVALRQKEIVVSLKLNWKLGQHNLDQLIKVGVVKNVPVTVLDKQSKYYEITSEELGKNLVQSFHNLVCAKIAKTFEYQKTYYISDLQNDIGFLQLCKKYDWSFDEAVENLRYSKKVEAVYDYSKKLRGFKRK